MKKFLKIAAIALSTTLATSVLFACNDNDDSSSSSSSSSLGTVTGSYQTVTTQQVDSAVSQLNYSSLVATDELGNLKTGWSMGLTLVNEGSFSLSGTNLSSSGDLDLEARLVGKESSGQLLYNAAIDLSAAISTTDEGTTTPASIDASAYYDSAFVYADIAATAGTDSLTEKAKLTVEDLLYLVDNFDPESFLPPQEEAAPLAASIESSSPGENVSELVGMLAELQTALGLEYSADFTNGTKLKVSTTDTTPALLSAMINTFITEEYGTEFGIAINFSKSKMDVYLCADAQNNFTQLAISLDIAAAFTMEETTYNITFVDALSLQVTGWQNVLPDGLATDATYELFTPSQSPTPVE